MVLDKQNNFDYIIVGAGLAGIAFAETCLKNNKTVFVFDNNSQSSSKVAAGIYNPVVLKRFSGLEHSEIQLEKAATFYNNLESKLNATLDHKIEVLRKFFSIEEQNNWFLAADRPNVSAFLSLEIQQKKIKGIDAQFGYGKVYHTGFVDTALLVKEYHLYLSQKKCFASSVFDYSQIQFQNNKISYKNISAKQIVFAEGFGLRDNPFFNYLPLDGTKGELLIIRAPDLELDSILNSSLYIVPLGNNLFKVGATYEWTDKTETTTTAGKNEILDKLKFIINCEFEVVEHLAGIRPTVKDRKLLLGTHRFYQNLHIMNGMGTRGVMQAPWAAEILFDAIEQQTDIEKSINSDRFNKLLFL